MKKDAPFSLFAIELILFSAFAIYLFFKVMVISADPVFTVKFSSEGFDYFIVSTLGIAAIGIYWHLLKIHSKYAAWNKDMTQLLRMTMRKKTDLAKTDPRHIGLGIIEFAIIFGLALAFWSVFDNTSIGLVQEGLSFEWKLIGLLIVIAIAIYVYTASREFRVERKIVSKKEREVLIKRALMQSK
jgi:hypothetical protein